MRRQRLFSLPRIAVVFAVCIVQSMLHAAEVKISKEWEQRVRSVVSPSLYTRGRYFVFDENYLRGGSKIKAEFYNEPGVKAWDIRDNDFAMLTGIRYNNSERILLDLGVSGAGTVGIMAVNPDGKIVWSKMPLTDIVVAPEYILARSTGIDGKLLKMEEETGAVIWERDIDPPWGAPHILDHRGTVLWYLGSSRRNEQKKELGILAVVPHEGEPRYFTLPFPKADTIIPANDGVLYCWFADAKALCAFDRNFKLLWIRHMPFSPQIVDEKGYLYTKYYAHEDGSKPGIGGSAGSYNEFFFLEKYRPDGVMEEKLRFRRNITEGKSMNGCSPLFINHNDNICVIDSGDLHVFHDGTMTKIPLDIEEYQTHFPVPDILKDGTVQLNARHSLYRFSSNLYGFSQNAVWPTPDGDHWFPHNSLLITETKEKDLMTWTEVPGAEYYHLVLTNSANSVVYENEKTEGLSMPLPGKLPAGIYNFKVRAGAGGEWGEWSLLRSVQKIPGLAVSTIAMNYDYSGDNNPRTFFHWYTETRLLPDKYEFKITDQQGAVVIGKALDINNCSLDAPLKPGSYRMAARSGIDDQWSEWKDEAFTILPRPENLEMTDKYSGSPTFAWDKVKGATSYRFTIYSPATGKEFVNEVVTAPRRAGAFVFAPGEKYAWKVWAIDELGISEPETANIVLLGIPETGTTEAK